VLSATKLNAALTHNPWALLHILTALRPSPQITADCWPLLVAPDGSTRKEHYLPKGEQDPGTDFRKRLGAARPSSFFRNAL
jgi:hypothetical protein